MEIVRWESRQLTLPLFDQALLSLDEEMAEVVEIKPGTGLRRSRIEIMGGMNKGSGSSRRMFAAGRIRMSKGKE